MARTFSSGARLDVGSLPTSTLPLTFACWAYSTSATANQTLMEYSVSGSRSAIIRIDLRGGETNDPLRAIAFDNGVFDRRNYSNNYPTSTWFHAAGVFRASSAPTAYLDGTAGSTTLDSGTVSTSVFDQFAMGDGRFAGSWSTSLTGRIAWPCVWQADLGQGEIDALAAGAHPLTIRPGSIVLFAPLTGATSGNEIDIIGGLTLAETGTVGTAESPLVSMGGVWPANYTPAAGGATTGILRNQTRAIERGHSGVAAAQLGGVLA